MTSGMDSLLQDAMLHDMEIRFSYGSLSFELPSGDPRAETSVTTAMLIVKALPEMSMTYEPLIHSRSRR